MERIIRNAIKCNYCGDILESKYTHDFKMCSCGKVGVDGGHSYLRRCFTVSQKDYEELSISESDKEETDDKSCALN